MCVGVGRATSVNALAETLRREEAGPRHRGGGSGGGGVAVHRGCAGGSSLACIFELPAGLWPSSGGSVSCFVQHISLEGAAAAPPKQGAGWGAMGGALSPVAVEAVARRMAAWPAACAGVVSAVTIEDCVGWNGSGVKGDGASERNGESVGDAARRAIACWSAKTLLDGMLLLEVNGADSKSLAANWAVGSVHVAELSEQNDAFASAAAAVAPTATAIDEHGPIMAGTIVEGTSVAGDDVAVAAAAAVATALMGPVAESAMGGTAHVATAGVAATAVAR